MIACLDPLAVILRSSETLTICKHAASKVQAISSKTSSRNSGCLLTRVLNIAGRQEDVNSVSRVRQDSLAEEAVNDRKDLVVADLEALSP